MLTPTMSRPSACSAAVLAAIFLVSAPSWSSAQDSESEEVERGLVRNEPGAQDGYTLFTPFASSNAYLIDMQGRVVHQWIGDPSIGSPYLMENGDIVYCTTRPGEKEVFTAPGADGLIQRRAWDGTLVWEFEYGGEDHLQHHDIAITPDGTVLMIAWELRSNEEALAAGRDPALLGDRPLWPDHVVEFDPGPDGAELLWEWRVWDHLIQDHDPSKANYGVVAEHPELVDINGDDKRTRISAEEMKRLQALGYVHDAEAATRDARSDWLHINGIDYNAELDQIVLSVPRFHEVWIIDHSTDIAEAAGHEGGRSGRGGDLLYRWGNPRSYRMGSHDDQVLEFQHDARWIPADCPGAGRLTIFNNGSQRKFSSVVELLLEPDANGCYPQEEGMPFGPERPHWEYRGANLFSDFVSGAHRLPNGNTFICEGRHGRLLEVTPAGEVVWEYRNPIRDNSSSPPGAEFGMFRATRIPADHPALRDKVLRPLKSNS